MVDHAGPQGGVLLLQRIQQRVFCPGSVVPPPIAEPVDLRGKLPTLDLAAWPGAEPYRTDRDLSKIVGVTIHYTGVDNYDQTARDIALYQISAEAAPQTGAGQPFPGIAYTLLVAGDGKFYLCWDLNVRVWHSAYVDPKLGGRNGSHIGIVYVGGPSGPRPAQVQGLANAIRWCQRELGRPLGVEGHKDPPYATSCPGPQWPGWKAGLLAKVAAG